MSYVPIVVPPPSPSPRTRELADLLAQVIREYEAQHPSVTSTEVREAARLASASAATGLSRQVVAVTLGLGVAALAGAIAFARSSGLELSGIAWPLVLVAVLLVVGILVALARRSP